MAEVPWDPSYDQEWAKTVSAWSWIKDGSTWRHEGTCPNCGHEMVNEVEVGTLSLGLKVEGAGVPDVTSVPVMVLCNCRSIHTGRPEGENEGCGKAAKLLVPFT